MAPTYQSTGTYGSSSGGVPQTSVACGVPSGVVADDIVVLTAYVSLDGGINPVATPPAGFTAAENAPISAQFNRNAVWWKRATGSESGTYTISYDVATYSEAAAMRFSGCVTSGNPFDSPTNAAFNNTSSTASAAVTVTTLGADRVLVHSATNWSGGTWTPSSGFTTRASGGFGVLHAATKDQAVAGSSGSVTATCTGSDKTTGWLGALAGPAPSSWVYGYDVRIG